MNSVTLTQATLIALTMQNQAQKVAPLSTATMQGIVINRNIAIGETVCCYYNDSGELTRLGDIPNHSGDFFVDEDNRMYYVENDRLHVIDGLSGYVYSDNISAYGFAVYDGGAIAAYKTQSNAQTWKVIYQDGEMSGEITLPDDSANFRFAYRNGVLALVQYKGVMNYSYGLNAYTYTKNGTLIAELAHVDNRRAEPSVIVPMSSTSVGIAFAYGAGFYDSTYYAYSVVTSETVTTSIPWSEYNTQRSEAFVGADQSSIYTTATLYEEVEIEEGITELVVAGYAYARFSIEHFNGLEILEETEYPVNYYGPPTQLDSIIRQYVIEEGEEEVTIIEMVDASDLTQKYANEPLTLTAASNTIRENEEYIWIVGSGVYQKTQLGWLMYATSIYPRATPWGKLGYAIRNTQVGRNGLAIVLFE